MTWFVWLGLAVVITAFAALSGSRAKGTRPVGGSRLMSMGRLVLWVFVLLCAYLAFRGYSGRS